MDHVAKLSKTVGKIIIFRRYFGK